MGELESNTELVRQLKGHLGNLTPEQEQALSTFKENLIKADLYKPGTESQKPSHDDPTLL